MPNYTFLSSAGPLNKSDIHDLEQLAYGMAASIEQNAMVRLINEWIRLSHELDDPRYLYSGRIPRGAILGRDAEIDKLRAEISQLKKESPQ